MKILCERKGWPYNQTDTASTLVKTILSNTQLEIADGVTLALYLGGTFSQSSNSQINNLSQDPTTVQIYGTETFETTMTWESNASFYGAIYVPDYTVLYNSNAEFYGSIIADTVKIDSNAGGRS